MASNGHFTLWNNFVKNQGDHENILEDIYFLILEMVQIH